jgi:hypothetical protein
MDNVEHLFAKHFAEHQSLQDISTIELPDDPKVLRALARRCLDASRAAVRTGKSMEVRRLTDLASQLEQRARKS